MSNDQRNETTATAAAPDPKARYVVKHFRHRGHYVVDRKTHMTVFGPVTLPGVAQQAADKRNGK